MELENVVSTFLPLFGILAVVFAIAQFIYNQKTLHGKHLEKRSDKKLADGA